ncbi:MAG: hypothetical protein K2F64_03055, partial [Muribaculaceae bacterium]|nr:hypothetical protein [Muribaculaceae bacterium]
MNIKTTITRCLREWGYKIKDDEGGILLNDGITIDIIRPQKYVTIDAPVFSADLEEEELCDMLLKTCNVLNGGYVWHTHFQFEEQWQDAMASLEFDWTSGEDAIFKLHKAMLIIERMPEFFEDALSIVEDKGEITPGEIWKLEQRLMDEVYIELMASKTLLYIHGLASSGNSGTAKEIQHRLPKTRILAPDLPVDPQEAYEMLCRLIDEEKVDVMVGSSMGGMFANVINGTAKVLVNPSFHVSESMRKRIGRMSYFSQRKDGATEFEITHELCDAYAKLERNQFAFFHERETGETFALFGNEDDTVNCKDEYIKYFGDAYETFIGGHRLNPEIIHDKLCLLYAY